VLLLFVNLCAYCVVGNVVIVRCQVFEQMIDSNQTSVVHDWVILSLSNFTQRTPLAMAIWSLTCFFISASVNSWLRALYLLLTYFAEHVTFSLST